MELNTIIRKVAIEEYHEGDEVIVCYSCPMTGVDHNGGICINQDGRGCCCLEDTTIHDIDGPHSTVRCSHIDFPF